MRPHFCDFFGGFNTVAKGEEPARGKSGKAAWKGEYLAEFINLLEKACLGSNSN